MEIPQHFQITFHLLRDKHEVMKSKIWLTTYIRPEISWDKPLVAMEALNIG